MTHVSFHRDSYQVEAFTTKLEVNLSYLEFKLARLIEEYPYEDFEDNRFWAEVETDGKYKRYRIRENKFGCYLTF